MPVAIHRGALRNVILCLFALILMTTFAADLAAQEGDQEPAAASEQRFFITGSDTSTVPVVALRTYGFTQDGRPLDLTQQSITVEHDGVAATGIEVGPQVEVGTFTVFLVDLTPGVQDQVAAVQQAIQEFATPTYMKEQVDWIAIYRVGETGAVSLLEPTNFHNTVRNFFAEPLQPQDGPTALFDSLVGLINEVPALRPEAALVPSIVVFSDGTDSVSTNFEAGDPAVQARAAGVPVHTVWLQNQDLTVGQEAGRNYLGQLAGDAYGLPGRVDQPETVNTIFDRITDFRGQQLLRYSVPEAESGTATVVVSAGDEPGLQVETAVNINPNSPVVALTVPPDSRTITLPDLEEPVEMTLSAEVTWLDGVERSLEEARLLVNGQPIQEIPPGDLDRFEATIDNFIFGDNTVRVSVVDEQGLPGMSPEITLTVVEGELAVPEALQPQGGLIAAAAPLCLGALLVLAVVGLAVILLRRTGRLSGLGRSRRTQTLSADAAAEGTPDAMAPPPPVPVAPRPSAADSSAIGPAHLEVVESATSMPRRIPLESDEIRLGRSPNLADVAFEQDITVSRLHASIIWDGHSYRLYDDDSTSGTWVNDQEVPDYGIQLFDGDLIYMGKVVVRFRQA